MPRRKTSYLTDLLTRTLKILNAATGSEEGPGAPRNGVTASFDLIGEIEVVVENGLPVDDISGARVFLAPVKDYLFALKEDGVDVSELIDLIGDLADAEKQANTLLLSHLKNRACTAEEELRHLQAKVAHGCTDATCPECDQGDPDA